MKVTYLSFFKFQANLNYPDKLKWPDIEVTMTNTYI